jgi:hypothetical protein
METQRRTRISQGLMRTFEEKKAASVVIVERAISKLIERGERVTLAAIVSTASALASESGDARHTVCHTTILRNQRCRELYEASRVTDARRSRSDGVSRRTNNLTEAEQSRIRYLCLKRKRELALLLILRDRELSESDAVNAKLRSKLISLTR